MTSFVVALCQSSSAHISRTRTKRHAYWRFFSILALVGALKRNVALQELYLSENNLNGYQDSMQLGDLLKYNSTLKTLDLSNNTMSDSGMPFRLRTYCVLPIARLKRFLWLKCTVCFSSCVVISLCSTGLEEICDALSSQKTGLRTLILSNNHITHLGMSHLQNVLVRFSFGRDNRDMCNFNHYSSTSRLMECD